MSETVISEPITFDWQNEMNMKLQKQVAAFVEANRLETDVGPPRT
jgi:hypothetical protein